MALVRVWTGRPRPVSEAWLVVGGEQFEPLPDPLGVDASAWRGGFPIPTALLDAAGGSVQLVLDGRRFDVAPPVDPRVATLEAALSEARADSRATLLQLDAERRRARESERGLREELAARSAELAEMGSLRAALEARDGDLAALREERQGQESAARRLRDELRDRDSRLADVQVVLEARASEAERLSQEAGARAAEAEELEREAASLRAALEARGAAGEAAPGGGRGGFAPPV